MQAVILWVMLRIMFWRLVARMRAKVAASRQCWTRQGSILNAVFDSPALPPPGVAQEALELVQEGYALLARPLEPFLIVFLFFGIPAATMSTDFCQQNSDTENYGPTNAESGFSAAR